MTSSATSRSWPPKELFSHLRLEWLDSYRFSSPDLERLVTAHTRKCFVSGPLFQKARWLGAYYRREALGPPHADLYLRWLGPKVGFGLFTKRPLPAGWGIGSYLGLVRERPLLGRDTINSYCFTFATQPSWWRRITHGAWTVDALTSGNHTRFINHSSTPNCESLPLFIPPHCYIFIATREPVGADQQLFYDYGPDYWKDRDDQIVLPQNGGKSCKVGPFDPLVANRSNQVSDDASA